MKLMKLLLICLLTVSMLMMACTMPVSEDELPPEPPKPGMVGSEEQQDLSGQVWKAEYAEYGFTEPTTFTLSQDILEPGDELTATVNEDFIYSVGYATDSDDWTAFQYEGDEMVGKWIKKQAWIDFLTAADFVQSYSEFYLLAYACTRVGNDWDCHDYKWMMHSFEIMGLPDGPIDPVPMPAFECDFDNECLETESCVNNHCVAAIPIFECQHHVDCAANEFCFVMEGENGGVCVEPVDEQEIQLCLLDSECEDGYACFMGECIKLPDEPVFPGQEEQEDPIPVDNDDVSEAWMMENSQCPHLIPGEADILKEGEIVYTEKFSFLLDIGPNNDGVALEVCSALEGCDVYAFEMCEVKEIPGFGTVQLANIHEESETALFMAMEEEMDEPVPILDEDTFCGNGIVEDGEFCDGLDFAGLDCTSDEFSQFEFTSGTLSCLNDCNSISVMGCVVDEPEDEPVECLAPGSDEATTFVLDENGVCYKFVQTCVHPELFTIYETEISYCAPDDDDGPISSGGSGGSGDGGSDSNQGGGEVLESVCGNYVIDEGEECDDGETNDDGGLAGGCREDCTLIECGDGIIDANAGEECDDGDANDDGGLAGGCREDCTLIW
ncbi:hypothetical protein HN695_00465 [Candidatus Woesearchaeota archaeon]|nr:hypothetical protein [Candidatus Woesearchaeota archaeon]MBT5271808.1 hypothetical protein [Candidatus Woesearchaeota archaeon]MBT6040673.1 hypothetical protein [Candidatus Woesearchaeota archaeon]MBT6336434.1 hypothetical protein [Candidatus Woesearchaeota archaeon]MBT7926786.1 hypothetical protein [Candidatus Woesearchaeota archaeon]